MYGFPAVGAALFGALGWLLGPPWAVAGILVGAVAGVWVLLMLFTRGKPDPELLLAAGRPQEAYRQLHYELSFARVQARKRPILREVFANQLETMSLVLQALGNEPKALEIATEAVGVYTDLSVKRHDRHASALARSLLQQGALLASMGRHGEALAAIEPALQIYRRLAVKDRNAYLPSLIKALNSQADELGHLDRITEARTASAEAELISTDMLPSTQ